MFAGRYVLAAQEIWYCEQVAPAQGDCQEAQQKKNEVGKRDLGRLKGPRLTLEGFQTPAMSNKRALQNGAQEYEDG